MELPAFRAALGQYPQAIEELPDNTLVRYMKGDFPRAVKWLLRYPALLRALADDADQQMVQGQSQEEGQVAR